MATGTGSYRPVASSYPTEVDYMKIKIYSLKQFYRVIQAPEFDHEKTVAVISSSYPIDEERLRHVLHIACQYDDIDYEVLGRCFTLIEAKKIVRFLRSCEDKVTTICCVCDGGCRRSSAVAAALYRFYGREAEELKNVWQNPVYEPNLLVYRVMASALNVPVDDNDIDLRIWENRSAIRKRIRGCLS